jgi:serine/threonine-protein kinase
MNDAINSVRSLAARYTIERELGSGATATVFLGWDVKHKRHVAVKILKPEVTVTLGAERFLREIETTANLRHPHIVPLYDSGEARGALYYVMPFVEGESLRQRLTRDGQLPLDDAIRIAREVAGALSYAHARGIVHRDIKPENILLESGHAVVTDFGIARAVREAGTESLTGAGISLGTPAYMSPEQAAGEREVDGRTDLYSLGCVLYEMLGGQPPFTGPSMPSIIRQHLVAEPRPIATLRPTVPAPVWAALERALAKNPADRFGLVSQFADALGPVEPAAVSTTPLSTPALPTTTPPTASPRPHTERLLLTISVVLAVVLVLVVAFAVWQSTSR